MKHTKRNQNELFEIYPDVMTVCQVGEALGIGRAGVYKLIEEGSLKAFKIGKAFKVPKSSLSSFIEKRCAAEERGL